MKKLRVGIVGCGLIAKVRHMPAYIGLREIAEVVAVCDLSNEIANAFAKNFKIKNIYNCIDGLLYKEKLDVIDICVPPSMHAFIACKALENGCHVLMEKPMALSIEDCDKIIELADKYKLKVCIIHNNLFHPPFLKAKDLISCGGIGNFLGMRILLSTPKSYMLEKSNYWYHKLPGGLISETGPHIAYMALHFLENIIDLNIWARSKLKYPWAPFDDFVIDIEGLKGNCTVNLCYTSNCWAANIEIIGSDAILTLDIDRMMLTKSRLINLDYFTVGKSMASNCFQMFGNIISNAYNVLIARNKMGTDIIIEKFLHSIVNGSKPPVDAIEGRKVVEFMNLLLEKYEGKYLMGAKK